MENICEKKSKKQYKQRGIMKAFEKKHIVRIKRLAIVVTCQLPQLENYFDSSSKKKKNYAVLKSTGLFNIIYELCQL